MLSSNASAPVGATDVSRWLAWQEHLHSAEIELGLERVRRVADRLDVLPPAKSVITVAGTNGKGSCVAFIATLVAGCGCLVGTYTSPHILRYNERIGIDGRPITDVALCRSFAAVEAARQAEPLTYFEYGTLAALHALKAARVDVAVLEVGLGGRLDAVNVADADAALISSIELDHMDWLGGTRELIGSEKAGIFRAGRPAVSADPDTPASVRRLAEELGAHYLERGRDFQVQIGPESWRWSGPGRTLDALPVPHPGSSFQIDNAAGCLALLDEIPQLRPPEGLIRSGLRQLQLPGRQQSLGTRPDRLVDVGHNPAAARALAERLGRTRGAVRVVIGMLKDKDHVGYVEQLAGVVDYWYPAATPGSRGFSAVELARLMPEERLRGRFADPHTAWRKALGEADADDLIVACGSFLTVAEILGAEEPIG